MPPIQCVQVPLLGVKRLQREATRLYLAPRLRMNGAIPLRPYMPSLHGQ